MSKNDNHLPVYGVGPILVSPIAATTIIGLILSYYEMIPKFQISYLNWFLIIVGLFLILVGILFWIIGTVQNCHD